MTHDRPAYGLWSLVVINIAIFAIFAYSFTRPRTARDWRSFGAFGAFLVALFVEMYGFPLTIYLLAGWLQRRYPGLDLLSHDAGHLWETLLGWRGNPHFNPLHLLSSLLIAGGFILLARSWPVLYAAQQHGKLATTGPTRTFAIRNTWPSSSSCWASCSSGRRCSPWSCFRSWCGPRCGWHIARRKRCG
jgi:hypothetical protein